MNLNRTIDSPAGDTTPREVVLWGLRKCPTPDGIAPAESHVVFRASRSVLSEAECREALAALEAAGEVKRADGRLFISEDTNVEH